MGCRIAAGLVTALAAASLACGDSAPVAGIDDGADIIEIQEGQGLLEGIVHFIGVPCPLIYPQRPPCDGLYPDYEVIVLASDGQSEAARARSDADGRFQLALPHGVYVIYTQAGIHEDMQERNEVTILAGDTTRVDLVIDTGIR